MMTQSVMTQAANLFGNAAGSVTLKGKQTGSGFNLMIDNNLKAPQNSPGNDETATIRKTSVKTADTASSNQSDEPGRASPEAQADQTKAAVQTQETGTAKKTEDVPADIVPAAKEDEASKTENTETPVIDDQLLVQIIGMLQAVSDAVMQKLNLSPEEFQQLLNEQGMTAMDLLEPENLQKFILADSGETDILSVLTNENLADTMEDLLNQVEEIKTGAGIPLTINQIKEILVQADTTMKALPKQDNKVIEADTSMQEGEVISGKQTENLKAENTVGAVNVTKEEGNKTAGNESTEQALAERNVLTGTSKTESSEEGYAGTQKNTGDDKGMDLKASDQFQVFIDNMVKASKDTVLDFNGSMNLAAQLREISDQIIERIRISIAPDQSSMELQLNPESLGKVNLTVQSRDGVMTAQFVVQNELSKEAIESQMNTLRETLNQQGIKVEAIEVTVSANAFEQNNGDSAQNQTDTEKNNSGKKLSLEDAINMTETPEEESFTEDITGTLGSQIDYTA